VHHDGVKPLLPGSRAADGHAKVTAASLRRRLGYNARRLRDAAGLTQTEAAERVGLGLRQWQKIEACQSNATLSTLVRIAAAFEVDIAELFRRRR
jgi:DNA-binding XRE family transcriptional regulator